MFALSSIKQSLLLLYDELKNRELLGATKWVNELILDLKKIKLSKKDLQVSENLFSDEEFIEEYEEYYLSKVCFSNDEFSRAAQILKNCKSKICTFLHFYSRYKAGLKNNAHNFHLKTELIKTKQDEDNSLKWLHDLQHDMNIHCQTANCPYIFWLQGVVLLKCNFHADALDAFVKSLTLHKNLWPSWLELAHCISNESELNSLKLPDCWMKYFFSVQVYVNLQNCDELSKHLNLLISNGFDQSFFVLTQSSLLFNILRDVDTAVEKFKEIEKKDNCRLDHLDTYSNLLYVQGDRKQLAYLAQHLTEVDRFKPETCCVIANYYSIRDESEKAILYFQRALRLNPNFSSAWILMGHEFVQLKNPAAAIRAYSRMTELNPHDHRSWYGLGQAYEIMKMPNYSLYYFKKAFKLRPNDSRMLLALGDCYNSLNMASEARKCYWHAHVKGDDEGIAMFQLANAFKIGEDEEQAAAAFSIFINEIYMVNPSITKPENVRQAFLFLAQYNVKIGKLDVAEANAQKCVHFPETRGAGKEILNEINNLRMKSNQ